MRHIIGFIVLAALAGLAGCTPGINPLTDGTLGTIYGGSNLAGDNAGTASPSGTASAHLNDQDFSRISGSVSGTGDYQLYDLGSALAGEEWTIRMELKLIADVGLVGKPNAGKSTLLSVLTRAKPRIDAFPFSTLKPSLGIVPYGVYQRFVMADIPGLAGDARHGRGLGHQFLRHIQRTKLLVMLIEATEENYQTAFNQLIEELDGFSDELSGIPRIVVISKSDLLESDKLKTDFPFEMKISSISGEGLEELVEAIAERLGLVQEVRS